MDLKVVGCEDGGGCSWLRIVTNSGVDPPGKTEENHETTKSERPGGSGLLQTGRNVIATCFHDLLYQHTLSI
jgi:hypothetical protein